VDNRSEARSRATERGPVFSGVLRPGHWRDHSRRRGFGVRVACLSLTALLLSTLAATLSGSPVAAQTATPISVPSDQGLSGSWVSPTGYAFVAFNEGTGLASRLVAIRPADGSELFSVDLPGVVWDVTFGADGGAFAAVNNNDGDDQGWVYKISPTGVIVERRDLAPYVLPNQIEFGADGRVYVTTWPDPGNGALLALNASSLATEAAVPLSEVGQLHARSSGLVLIVAGLVRFFGYADIGRSTAVSSNPPGITFSSVTPEGTAYTLWFENSVDGSRCSAGTVFYAAPDGTSRQIPTDPLFADFGGDGCRLADLEALPGGGAAIVAVAGPVSRIVWIDAQGHVQLPAERAFDAPLEARLTDLRVDGTGIVTLATTVSTPCPPGEFEDFPCGRVDLVGYNSGAVVTYTATIRADQANAGSVQLSSGAIGPERVFVGAGFVVLAGGLGSFYCGPGCGSGRPAWLFAPAPVSRRTWEDPAARSVPPPSPAPSCSGHAVVIGVRGSGDKNDDPGYNRDYPGRHAIAVAKLLKQRWNLDLFDDDQHPDDHVIGLRYQAEEPWSGAYGTSLNAGILALRSQIDRLRNPQLCGPNLPILLVGMSQGAHVIQSVLEQLADAMDRTGDTTFRSIRGVVLLASPRFDSDDIVARGTFSADHPLDGMARPAKVPPIFQQITKSYCQRGDAVCLFSRLNFQRDVILKRTHVHSQDYNPCDDDAPANDPCRVLGQPLLEDAAGLLAWLVRRPLGLGATPSPVGDLEVFLTKLSAAAVYARGAPAISYSWDFTGDGSIDQTTPGPLVRHVYTQSDYDRSNPIVHPKVRITHADGTTTNREVCIAQKPASC
jgi:Cutinase